MTSNEKKQETLITEVPDAQQTVPDKKGSKSASGRDTPSDKKGKGKKKLTKKEIARRKREKAEQDRLEQLRIERELEEKRIHEQEQEMERREQERLKQEEDDVKSLRKLRVDKVIKFVLKKQKKMNGKDMLVVIMEQTLTINLILIHSFLNGVKQKI